MALTLMPSDAHCLPSSRVRPIRPVLEAAGITDVLTKSLGSNNPINVVRATIAGLQSLRDPEQAVAARRALVGAE